MSTHQNVITLTKDVTVSIIFVLFYPISPKLREKSAIEYAQRVQVKIARVTWPGDTYDSVVYELTVWFISDSSLVDWSTIRSDSHEVCGGQRVLQVCELAVREAVAVGARGVLHISQELQSVLHAEKLFLRNECFQVLWTDLHVSLGSEGFWGMYLVKNNYQVLFSDK